MSRKLPRFLSFFFIFPLSNPEKNSSLCLLFHYLSQALPENFKNLLETTLKHEFMIFLINSHAAGHPRETIKEQSNGCADSVWLNCRTNEEKKF
jgi:hypothetical protein